MQRVIRKSWRNTKILAHFHSADRLIFQQQRCSILPHSSCGQQTISTTHKTPLLWVDIVCNCFNVNWLQQCQISRINENRYYMVNTETVFDVPWFFSLCWSNRQYLYFRRIVCSKCVGNVDIQATGVQWSLCTLKSLYVIQLHRRWSCRCRLLCRLPFTTRPSTVDETALQLTLYVRGGDSSNSQLLELKQSNQTICMRHHPA